MPAHCTIFFCDLQGKMSIYHIIAILIVITVHESAHAWMAFRLGDPTAKYEGRISWNPLRHLDLMGTLMLIFVGVGWGKPVHYNPNNLVNPKRDSALIAAAGPFINLLTALVFAIPFKYLYATAVWPPILHLFMAIIDLSIVLAIFNLLPLPPLDGSKVIGYFIPDKYQRGYRKYLAHGIKWVVLFVVIDFFVLGRFLGFSILHFIIGYLAVQIKLLLLMGT